MTNGLTLIEVSNKVGIEPKTILRWSSYFELNCERNEQGYELFTEHELVVIEFVSNKVNDGKKIENIIIPTDLYNKSKIIQKTVERAEYENKVDSILIQLENLQEKMSRKSGERIRKRVNVHQLKMESINNNVSLLQTKLEKIEINAERRTQSEAEDLPLASGEKLKKKQMHSFRPVKQVFSF
ncbi:MerR family transcriptional regulator [Bacillus suaedae]|uniref:MerR family transcriptional regulator n=1 Tax=Halalkalibacter suaedae TaxID=2822140 RepID=A0A941AQ00_9BACI|nr:MerR family transcriptional regulator [Bacillus suaedae]MBP3950638.1 MerR family transcriptional regulator [Bacillus suaedae]